MPVLPLRHFFLLIVVGVGSSVPAFSQLTKPVFQSWNEVQLIVPLIKGKDAKGKSFNRVTATFSGVERLGRQPVDAVDQRASATFDFRLNGHISAFAGLMARRDEITFRSPHRELRLDYGVILLTTWHGFGIKDRNMMEHRFRIGRVDTDLYRNRIVISHPVKHGDKVLFTPFVSEEVYYEISSRNWTQNEFYAGISRQLSKSTSLDIAYLRNDSKPAPVNGLALTLKITLR